MYFSLQSKILVIVILVLLIFTITTPCQTIDDLANPDAFLPPLTEQTVPVFIDTLMVISDIPGPADSWQSLLLSISGSELNEGLLAHDREAIMSYIREQGYWQAQVEITTEQISGTETALYFTVHEGTPVILGSIAFDGPTWIASTTSDPLPAYGSIFTRDRLAPVISSITSRATDEGYPGVTITPILSAQGDTVDVMLTVDPGIQAVIDSLTISGLTRTNYQVVLRELHSLLGLPANTAAISSARRLLRSLEIVSIAADPEFVYSGKGNAVLALRLTEGPQGSFDGALGYQPSAGSDGGELIGKIDLSFPNLTGSGRSAAFRWENYGKDTEDMALRYREPWIFNRPYTVSGSFLQEKRDNLGYTKTNMLLSIDRTFGLLSAEAGYRYEKISADSLTSSSGHGVDVSVTWTALDNRLNPRSGIRYNAVWTRLSKSYRFGHFPDHILERTEFNLDHFVPTFDTQTVAILMRYRRVYTSGGTLTPSDRYWLGGSRTIRGYREQSFPSVEAILANIEYRFIQSGRSRVFIFYDHGYLMNEESQPDGGSKSKTTSVYGYGFGLRIDSRAGTLGFDYGLGKKDALGEGKLHVRLSNNF